MCAGHPLARLSRQPVFWNSWDPPCPALPTCPQGKASYTLLCQVVETTVTLGLLRALTAGPLSRSPGAEKLELFVYDLRQPFAPPKGWALWALLGVAASPFVVGSVAALLSAVGYDKVVSGAVSPHSVLGPGDEASRTPVSVYRGALPLQAQRVQRHSH